MAIPESEKEYRWVKCGLLTNSCTQRMALCTSSPQIITRFKLMMNCPPQVTGPRTMIAVSWKTWKTRSIFPNVTITQLYHIGHDTHFKQKLTGTETSLPGAKRQDITSVRAAPRRRPLQLSLLLNVGLVFRPASLDLTALDPSTIQKTIEEKTQQIQWRMIVSPEMVAGQKQLNPCPIFERAATVDNTEVVNSSENLRASRWNFRFKYELPMLFRAANTRVPDRNCPSAIGGNLE